MYQSEQTQAKEAAHIDDVRKVLLRTGLAIVYGLVCYFLPKMTGYGSRNEACEFKMLLADTCFLSGLCGLIFLAHLGNLAKFAYDKRTKRSIELNRALAKNYFRCTIFTFFVTLFGFGGWFWSVQAMWPKFSTQDCLQGWDLLDFANFIVLQIYCAAYGAMLALMVVCCPCWSQKLVAFIRVIRGQAGQNQEEQL